MYLNSKSQGQPVKPENLNSDFVIFRIQYSTVPLKSVSGQRRFRSDCADSQSELDLCCPTSQEHTYVIMTPLNPTFM